MAISAYYDDYNPELLSLIPPDAKVVLEVGCGTGRLCEAYRRVNPEVRWFGAEKNREAAKEAETQGIDIFSYDIESWGAEYVPNTNVDCLILGDVLEHLLDPWYVLESLAPCLKPDGQVLASIPNVQHWTVIRDLLNGRWRYTDDGLLDRTHLRFFTLEGIRDMFRDAGLQVFEVRGRRLFNEGYQQFLTETRLDHNQHMEVYQWVIRAVRSDVPVPKLHIHAVGDGTICERPRLHEPLAMLATIPGVRCSIGQVPDPASNIIIIQRARNANLEWYRAWIGEGRLLIAEIDDDPKALEGLPECNFLTLRAVHAIQTTTEVMAETLRRFNPHVAVFPNQIASLPPMRDYSTEDHPIRIFFGALNREKDWEPIMPILNRVLSDYENFVVYVVHDRAFFDALDTMQKTFHPFCPWEEYRRILHICDVALLPLENTRFNRHKSEIKFLECAAEGVVCLMSEAAADQLPIIETNDAYRCYQDSRHFELVLRDLIVKEENRQRTAKIAYAYVRDHRLLSRNYRHRHDVYTHWLSRKSELDRDLLERVPELKNQTHDHYPHPIHA